MLRRLFLISTLLSGLFALVTVEAQEVPVAVKPVVEGSADPSGGSRAVMDDRTLYFWQPHEGRFSVQEAGYYYTTHLSSYSAAGVQTASTSQTEIGSTNILAFGLNENWAFMISAPAYSNTHSLVTPVTSSGYPELSFGFSDPSLTLENTTAMGAWRLHFGTSVSLPLSPLKKTTVSAAGNKGVGAPTVTPYLGFSRRLNSRNRCGAKISYEYFAQRIEDDQAGDVTIFNGGNTTEATVFYELRWHHFYLQPSLSNTWTDNREADLNGASTSTTATTTTTQVLAMGYYFTPSAVAAMSGTLTQVFSTPAQAYSVGFRNTVSFRYEF